MPDAVGTTERARPPVDRWLEHLGDRLRTLRLKVTFWDPTGGLLDATHTDTPFCEPFCRQNACVGMRRIVFRSRRVSRGAPAARPRPWAE